MRTRQATGQQTRAAQGPLVVLVSVVILAVVVVAVSALGTTILGLPTTYGSGIDPALGSKLKADFLADQEAEARALSQADQAPLGGYFTDSALTDLVQQISQESSFSPPTVSFQPASLTIVRATDSSNPALNLEVREDGSKNVVSSNGPNAAPTGQAISFQGDFWLRLTNGRYAVADQQVQNLSNSPVPAIATVVAALVALAILVVLVQRGRLARNPGPAVPSASSVRSVQPGSPQPPLSVMAEGASANGEGSGPRTVITTFGGLHVREAGQDFAPQLLARPVTGLVWLRLLVGVIRDPLETPSRDETAKQVYPRGGRESQLKGMRNFVNRGLPQMPAALRDRILVEPEVLQFKLDACSIDALDLLRGADELAHRSPLDAADRQRISRLLEASEGVFLPEYERIEEIATGGHPSSSEIVRQLRERISECRAQLERLIRGKADEA